MNDNATSSPWSRTAKIVASLAIAFHLLCVFVGPWSSPPPSTQLSRDIGSLLSPYIKFMAIDNGYRFFAPDPGPSHLVRYELRYPDGSKKSGTFPNRQEHWPRLLYHRHFMLSETIFTLAGPLLEAPAITTMSQEERVSFERRKRQVDVLQEDVAQYLLNQHPTAERVRLYSQLHEILSPSDVLQGRPLDDPTTYEEFMLGEYSR